MAVLNWLEHTSYAEWVNESWGWPLALTIHAFGTATVVGLTFIIGLRLFGLFRTIPFTSLKTFFPIIWVAVLVQAWSGFSLWMTKPARYLNDGMFQSKLFFVVVSILVMACFHVLFTRRAAKWDAAGSVSSLGVWIVVAAVVVVPVHRHRAVGGE